MTYQELFEEFRNIREMELERSREWLARQMGIDPSTLQDWELGYRALNLHKLKDWAEVLGYELIVTLKKK